VPPQQTRVTSTLRSADRMIDNDLTVSEGDRSFRSGLWTRCVPPSRRGQELRPISGRL